MRIKTTIVSEIQNGSDVFVEDDLARQAFEIVCQFSALLDKVISRQWVELVKVTWRYNLETRQGDKHPLLEDFQIVLRLGFYWGQLLVEEKYQVITRLHLGEKKVEMFRETAEKRENFLLDIDLPDETTETLAVILVKAIEVIIVSRRSFLLELNNQLYSVCEKLKPLTTVLAEM